MRGNYRIFLTVVALSLLAFACAGPQATPTPPPASPTKASAAQTSIPATPTAASKGEVKVGVNLELSGPASVWGQPQLNAVRLLAEQINAAGGAGGWKIKLVEYDNKSNETESLVVTRRLIEQDGVAAIIGGGTTPTTMPLIPVVTEAGVPLVSIGSSNAIVEPVSERKWVFKTPSNSRDIATRMLAFLKSKGWTKVAFMSVNNAYGDAGLKEFTALAPGSGVEVVAQEKFGATDTDMKPQLTRMKGANPQAIVVWAIPPAASIVDKNYKELGLTIPIIHDHGASSWTYVELSEGAANGAYVVTVKSMVADQLPDTDKVKAVALKYVKDYEAKYGKKAGGIDAMAYDAMLLLSKAIEKAGSDRKAIRDALEGLTGVVGATGVFNLSAQNHNGLAPDDLVVAQIKDNRWVLVER
jgi:branched-chain amino acid transport system substrate-binding protein